MIARATIGQERPASLLKDLGAPWFYDAEGDKGPGRGTLRDREGNALASFPVHPGGLGDEYDLKRGQLCALAPDLLQALAGLVDRCDHAPILEGNEGMRGPLLAEAKTVLLKAGIETARPGVGATYQGWMTFRGTPIVLVAEAKDRPRLVEALGLLLRANREGSE